MSAPRTEEASSPTLSSDVVDQPEIQRLLQRLEQDAGHLASALNALEAWSREVGYFRHLKRENEVLRFRDEAWEVEFRLQINYSRLGYQAPAGDRPACPLCIENIGVPGKELLRVYEFRLDETAYFSHPTPFPLCPGHFVLNRRKHEPMRIDHQAIRDAAAFLDRCPGWLAASNSDVEWAGASILGHHHAQVFSRFAPPVESARLQRETEIEGCRVGLVHWPAPVLRLHGPGDLVVRTATELLRAWKATDPGKATANFLMRETESGYLTFHLFPRHPDFRTRESLRDIKAEGVGIIEMAGEIIVPPRPELSVRDNVELFTERGPEIITGILSSNAPSGDIWDMLIGA